MTIQWKAKEKCEWNQGVVFYVANVTGKIVSYRAWGFQ